MSTHGRRDVTLVTLVVAFGLSVCGCQSAPEVPRAAWSDKITSLVRPSGPNAPRARAAFTRGERRFNEAAKLQGKDRVRVFAQAADDYAEAAKHDPGTPLEEDALFMQSESYFFADDYVEAASALEELVKRYPLSRHMDRIDQRRFKIAQYWLKLCDDRSTMLPNLTSGRRPATDTFGHALRLFDKIRFDDPTGKLADDATMAAASANFKRGKYYDADVLLTDLRENFPKSEHQFQAHLLGLKCKMLLYEGPDYDAGSLDEALGIIKSMAQLYPQESQPHKEYLLGAHKDIRLKKANLDFSLAQFYDNRKEYGAARIYYQEVIKNYADTNLALESENRLAAIGGEPPTPDEPLQWLANLFPEEEGRAVPLLARDTVNSQTR